MPGQPSAKRTLFFTDSEYYSGAEKSLAILAGSAAASGLQAVLMVTPAVADRFRREAPQVSVIAQASRSKLSPVEFFRLLGYLRRERPDLAVANMWSPYANTFLLLAARLAGVPVISIYHYYQQMSQVTGPLAPLKRWAYRFGEGLAARVLTVSQAHREVLVRQFGFPAAKVGVLPNGLPDPGFEPAFRDHSPRRFLCVGSLEPAKGHAFLLEVLKAVEAPWELTVVGDGPERERLGRLAAGMPVTFAGRQVDMAPFYQGHDVLLHPSEFENLSMAILEAMAAGLAVVANDVGGNAELVRPGSTGWLLPLHGMAAWQAAVSEAAIHPLTSYRKAARAAWSASFTPEKQLAEFFKQASIADKAGKR